jgi:Holliday junction DNA helicase RuvA
VIAQLTGTVVATEGNSLTLDVNGVGYLVIAPAVTLAALPTDGSKVTLRTHLIAREDEMSLYGFSDAAQLQAFRLLIGTTGVGPKVALALLSTLEVSELARALSTSDTRVITKVPGVGPKLAQRLCLELGDKMAAFVFEKRVERAQAGTRTVEENTAYEDAVEALIGLGYSRADARRAVDRARDNVPDRANAAGLIRAALNLLTGKS